MEQGAGSASQAGEGTLKKTCNHIFKAQGAIRF